MLRYFILVTHMHNIFDNQCMSDVLILENRDRKIYSGK